MRIMAFGALKINYFKLPWGQKLSAPHPMSALMPVVIYQAVTPGAQLFHMHMHNPGSVIGRIFIAVLDEMTIEASVVGAMI
jgi:hypothetical protein